jgi:amino acid transporter
VAAIVWALVYAELGSAYPYAGGDYVGVGSILGSWAGFASLATWAVNVIPTTALLAKVVAVYVAQVTPLASPELVTYGSLGAALAVALLGVRTSTMVTGLFLAIEMLAVLALIVAGLWHPLNDPIGALTHPMVINALGAWQPVAPAILALGAVNAAYATAGGNQAIAFGEELADPHRHMGTVILTACLIGAVATALPVIVVALSVGARTSILQDPAPFTAFMTSLAGRGAGLALSASVAAAVFNALIAQVMFAARLFFSFGRDRVFPAKLSDALARVHGSSGIPRVATILVAVGAAACCLLGSHVLLVFVSGLVVFSLPLVSIAVYIGRRNGLTGKQGFWRSPWFPMAPILGLVLTLCFAVADLFDPDVGRPSLLLMGALIGAALLWHRFVLSKRPGGWIPRLPGDY